jgi:hypothetical protein
MFFSLIPFRVADLRVVLFLDVLTKFNLFLLGIPDKFLLV